MQRYIQNDSKTLTATNRYDRFAIKSPRQKIVIDRVLVNTDLLIEPIEIKAAVNKYFQTYTGGLHHSQPIPQQWQARYLPVDHVDSSWYDSLLIPPTFNEWMSHIKDSPNNKAAGISMLFMEIHLRTVSPPLLFRMNGKTPISILSLNQKNRTAN